MPERADYSPEWILRRAAKAAVAGALCVSGARWLVNRFRRAEAGGVRVLILSYHRITFDLLAETRRSLSSLLTSADTLRRQIEQVSRERDIVSLADACRLLAAGRRSGRGHRGAIRDVATITLDDGYSSDFSCALPVLRHLRVPATVFVPSGFIGTERRLPHDRLYAALCELLRVERPIAELKLPEPGQLALSACLAEGPAATLDRLIATQSHDTLTALAEGLERRLGISERDLPEESLLMTWDEVRAVHDAGIDVGGHTVDHVALANVSAERARKEITGCRAELQRRLGTAPRHFAYPNGLYTPRVRRAVAEAGFEAAVTTEDLENQRGGDPYALKRKVLWENSTLGAVNYNESVAACNIDGVFGTLGWSRSRAVTGERPDRGGGLELGAR